MKSTLAQIKTKPLDLGTALDEAEVRARAYDACGLSHDEYDYEDERGHLQHDAAECPLCLMVEARADYFEAIRQPVVAAREKLQTSPRRFTEWAELAKLGDQMKAAQNHYAMLLKLGADLSTVRERCDAAAKEEFLESNYEILFDRNRKILAEQAAARKQNRVEKENGIVRIQRRRKPSVRSL